MRLEKIASVRLTPRTPFAFDSTFHKPDHFTTGDNCWMPGTRWQTWNWQGRQLGLKFANVGTVEQPGLLFDLYDSQSASADFVGSLVAEVEYRYNLGLDLAPFYQTFSGDPVLGPVMERWRGMRPGHPSSLYEYLIIGIVLQNATVRRSVQMFQALLTTFGCALEFDGQQLGCLWQPGALANVTEAELRALKVGYRAKSIKRIDEAFAQGLVDEAYLRTQNREAQKAALLRLYGVGPATVWYLLFDVFHHWDSFTHISPWEQKIYSKVFFDQDPENPVPVDRLLAHFEQYGAYKQLAVHYLWEDLWWKRENEPVPWLEKLIRL